MATPFHTTVRLHSIKNEQSNRTWNISGTVTKADEGKALSQDLTAPNTLKLAADGEVIVARLEIFEDRGVCTAQHHFTDKLPSANGATIAVGDTVVGAGGGTVKAAGTKNQALNYVAEVGNGFVTVVRM